MRLPAQRWAGFSDDQPPYSPARPTPTAVMEEYIREGTLIGPRVNF